MKDLQTEYGTTSSYNNFKSALIADNCLCFDDLDQFSKDELIADYITEYMHNERTMPIPKATQLGINKICSDLLLDLITHHAAGEKIKEIMHTSDIVSFIETDYDMTVSNYVIDSLDDEGLDSELVIADRLQCARSLVQENSHAGL